MLVGVSKNLLFFLVEDRPLSLYTTYLKKDEKIVLNHVSLDKPTKIFFISQENQVVSSEVDKELDVLSVKGIFQMVGLLLH